MRYEFQIVDVFTAQRFGGNQLAVLPRAAGLTTEQMQDVAAEFNFSETTFVLPPEDPSHTHKVRIFTPVAELPFAGHPNIGTAFVLAAAAADEPAEFRFEEAAGVVTVSVSYAVGEPVSCELTAPQPLTLGDVLPVPAVAASVSLPQRDIVTSTHPPQIATVGVPFLLVEVVDRAALARSRADAARLRPLLSSDRAIGVHLYTRDSPDASIDLQARMYAPSQGVEEDPATGSANCILAAMLTHYAPAARREFIWRIAQGIEMGRPSRLIARVNKHDTEVSNIWIGGSSVRVAEGRIEV